MVAAAHRKFTLYLLQEHDIPVGGGFLEKQLLKGIHATSDTADDVGGDFGEVVDSESSSNTEGDIDFSSRGIGAAADLDFVQASLRAESRGKTARAGV